MGLEVAKLLDLLIPRELHESRGGTYFFTLRLNDPAHIAQPCHKKGKNLQVNFRKGVTSNHCIG